MHVSIIITMLFVGIILGFIGAGGSGFIISLLTLLFGVSIHTALATALTAMIFSSLSGAVSHYREGNLSVKTGITAGLFGAAGAFIGSHFSAQIPSTELKWLTAGMLLFSACLLWLRMFLLSRQSIQAKNLPAGVNFIARSIVIGIITGILSGMFGIGSTPFIQLGLMVLLGLPVRQAAGTTMMVIIPIAIGGGIGSFQQGYLDIRLLLEVVAGTMAGSYIGAKFTNRAPVQLLKSSMIAVPIVASFLLIV
ncbi:sulfite exporter TauE/SafE family protein [Heyndrickxia acidiproducens]|uniref:sulfite exporter TauE/SafE family protein n=1 Tax=Heyndrickxia acidiproducens TaxID=1121084 RepID=UPI000379495E|nr:sulfite exporter TauE/SafE family protein [Heyndrickxia acidiproducens]